MLCGHGQCYGHFGIACCLCLNCRMCRVGVFLGVDGKSGPIEAVEFERFVQKTISVWCSEVTTHPSACSTCVTI
jgi:hypothetical protein